MSAPRPRKPAHDRERLQPFHRQRIGTRRDRKVRIGARIHCRRFTVYHLLFRDDRFCLDGVHSA